MLTEFYEKGLFNFLLESRKSIPKPQVRMNDWMMQILTYILGFRTLQKIISDSTFSSATFFCFLLCQKLTSAITGRKKSILEIQNTELFTCYSHRSVVKPLLLWFLLKHLQSHISKWFTASPWQGHGENLRS